jgi:mxaA protein
MSAGRPHRIGTCVAAVMFAVTLASDARGDAGAGAAQEPTIAAASAPPRPAVVEQPRPFGHAIGDVLSQRVLLVQGGRPFEPAVLPGPARLGVWFERRGARVEESADGRHWLVVDYQIVNAPPALATIRLPGWDLPGAHGAAPMRIPAWSITLAPLAARTATPADGLLLRPDHPPPVIDTGPLQRRLAASSFALGACLIAWGAWLSWRAWRASTSQPFARALRELRGLDDGSPAAWHALHTAFDRAGGEVARPATLGRLFERAPHLLPLRARIERFFAQSQARFFDAAPAADAESPLALCRALRRLERGAEP